MIVPPDVAVSLEKATQECFKRDPLEHESCFPGIWFRNVRNGQLAPFRCGTCAECLRTWSRRTRRGIYRAIRALGLSAMLTLTLPPEFHAPERFQDAIRARGEIQRRFNVLRTFLRKRGFMGQYLAVPEAHQDGTAHLHLAWNDAALVAAFGYDYRAVQAFLQEAWTRAGGGFLWWKRGRGNPYQAAAELSKYVGKAIAGGTGKASPPWTRARWCTVETGFRRKPYRRWWASRYVAEIVRGPVVKSSDEWVLVAEIRGHRVPMDPRDMAGSLAAFNRSQGLRYVPWSPGRSVAIISECDAHDPFPDEVFLCHHERPEHSLGCFCRPPWLDEPAPPRGIIREIVVTGGLARTDLCGPHVDAPLGTADLTDPRAPVYLDPSSFETFGPAAATDSHPEPGPRAPTQPDGGPSFPLSDFVREFRPTSGVPEDPSERAGPGGRLWICECVLCRVVGGGTCGSCPRCARGRTS